MPYTEEYTPSQWLLMKQCVQTNISGKLRGSSTISTFLRRLIIFMPVIFLSATINLSHAEPNSEKQDRNSFTIFPTIINNGGKIPTYVPNQPKEFNCDVSIYNVKYKDTLKKGKNYWDYIPQQCQ